MFRSLYDHHQGYLYLKNINKLINKKCIAHSEVKT
jgi:hypothetical protein